MNLTVKKLLLALVFCWVGQLTMAQETINMTLDKAVEYALANNDDIRIAQLNIEDAEQRILETRATGLPQINANLDFNRYLQVPVQVLPEAFVAASRDAEGNLPEGFSRQVAFILRNQFQGGVNLQTMVFDGSFFTGLKAAQLYRTLVQDELAAKKQSIRNQVITAYLPIILLTESIKILNNNITNIEALYQETSALYKEGFVEQLDVDRLELSRANLLVEKENLERQMETTMNDFKLLMGFPVNTKLIIEDNLGREVPVPTNEALTGPVDYYNRREYKVAETGIQLNDLNIQYVKNSYLPKLNLNLSYNQAYQGDQLFDDPNSFWAPTALVGLSLRAPLFDGFGRKAKIERAQLASEISRVQQQQFGKRIDQEVANARIDYQSALQRLASQKRNMDLAERIYETTKIKYKEGVGSSIELSQAEQSLFAAQRNHLQSMFDLLIAKLALDVALGT
ncbi:MAG: TolC family protein [Bacteroidota bacterium]